MFGRARFLAVLALLPAFAGCGGGGDDTASKPSAAAQAGGGQSSGSGAAKTSSSAAETIRAWADGERQNKMSVASRYFSVPAIVLNGGPPLLLTSRSQVLAWNAALPCGAKLLRTVDVRGWTIARFLLTDRQGGNCDGIGHTASTAFAMRKGKIALWIRVRDDIPPAKAAPARSPDKEFILKGKVRGHPAPSDDSSQPAV
jgi:hypothetical protein